MTTGATLLSPARRRQVLYHLLWQQRFQTRQQLIAWAEFKYGKSCLGRAVSPGAFFRDMQAVRRTFAAAGFELAYSRQPGMSGYFLRGEPAFSPELTLAIKAGLAEADPAQIDIFCRLTPAQRFAMGASISDAALQAVAYRLRLKEPGLSPAEAKRRVLAESYTCSRSTV